MLASERTPYMLSERWFAATLAFALLLHMAGFVVWKYAPKPTVEQLQIRTLNVRLGEADELTPEMLQPSAENPSNLPQVQAIIERIAQDAAVRVPAPSAKSSGIKQYVREVNKVTAKPQGVRDGKRDAEIMSRYTQVISLWIQKFKLYPEEARQKNLKGSTIVRIRIDRQGNVRYYALERSTGVELLDRAALDMIRRANPVPAAPADYPPGELLEFLIPVNFNLI